MTETETLDEGRPSLPPTTVGLAALLALLVPGLGHFYLGRRRRGLLFTMVILASIVVGVLLQGNLWTPVEGRPLTYLATLGTMGMGLPYLILEVLMKYEGVITGIGYDYGTAFLTSAGLMNLLLVLDTVDIASGKKT